VLASVQLVTRTPDDVLLHVGSIRPVELLSPGCFRRHEAVAQQAARAIQAEGCRGLVGIDTFETDEGNAVVSDVNVRVNASTFLAAVPLETGRAELFCWGLVGEGGPGFDTFLQAVTAVKREMRGIVELCFSPVVIDESTVGVNLRIEGRSLDELRQALRSLLTRASHFRSPVNEDVLSVVRGA